MNRAGMVAGVDEAGRGPLAGPVVAAAVILGRTRIAGLDDSKALSDTARRGLFDEVRARAQSWAVGLASVTEIDTLNIHHATLLAMQRAVAGLARVPDEALVDGRFCPRLPCAGRAIVGGDASEPAISAASIIAKVWRDDLMIALDCEFPVYGFARHKGYPTRAHLAALDRHGVCPAHRRSYAPVQSRLSVS